MLVQSGPVQNRISGSTSLRLWNLEAAVWTRRSTGRWQWIPALRTRGRLAHTATRAELPVGLQLFLACPTLADEFMEALYLLHELELLAFLVAILGLLCHHSLLIWLEQCPARGLYHSPISCGGP